jgi:hypothetical protein
MGPSRIAIEVKIVQLADLCSDTSCLIYLHGDHIVEGDARVRRIHAGRPVLIERQRRFSTDLQVYCNQAQKCGPRLWEALCSSCSCEPHAGCLPMPSERIIELEKKFWLRMGKAELDFALSSATGFDQQSMSSTPDELIG